MLSTTTILFELPPQVVKIAIKVIDQTGTEHITVIDDPRMILEDNQHAKATQKRKAQT